MNRVWPWFRRRAVTMSPAAPECRDWPGSEHEFSLMEFSFTRAAMLEHARGLANEFPTRQPFPHVVIADLIPIGVLRAVADEFPETGWFEFDDNRSIKSSLNEESVMGSRTRQLIRELNGQVFIDFLEAVTGITGLIPDPHLEGAGLHQIRQGGFLKIHTDFNRHKRLNLDRRLNLLVYLNDEWKEGYGGYLELWNPDLSACVKRIAPTLGTSVLFETTDHSPHGHPEPLTCPADRTRRSIAMYYYSNGRPEGQAVPSFDTPFYDESGARLDYLPNSRPIVQ